MKAEQFAEIRKALGLTQAEMAVVLDVQRNTVARWETGVLAVSRVVELAVMGLSKKRAQELLEK